MIVFCPQLHNIVALHYGSLIIQYMHSLQLRSQHCKYIQQLKSSLGQLTPFNFIRRHKQTLPAAKRLPICRSNEHLLYFR